MVKVAVVTVVMRLRIMTECICGQQDLMVAPGNGRDVWMNGWMEWGCSLPPVVFRVRGTEAETEANIRSLNWRAACLHRPTSSITMISLTESRGTGWGPLGIFACLGR